MITREPSKGRSSRFRTLHFFKFSIQPRKNRKPRGGVESHKSPQYDVNFSVNRLRECWIPNMVHVYNFFRCFSLVLNRSEPGKGRLKRTTLEGSMFCACVTRISEASKQNEKCLAFRTLSPQKTARREVDGNMLRRITHCVCVRFSGFCSA